MAQHKLALWSFGIIGVALVTTGVMMQFFPTLLPWNLFRQSDQPVASSESERLIAASQVYATSPLLEQAPINLEPFLSGVRYREVIFYAPHLLTVFPMIADLTEPNITDPSIWQQVESKLTNDAIVLSLYHSLTNTQTSGDGLVYDPVQATQAAELLSFSYSYDLVTVSASDESEKNRVEAEKKLTEFVAKQRTSKDQPTGEQLVTQIQRGIKNVTASTQHIENQTALAPDASSRGLGTALSAKMAGEQISDPIWSEQEKYWQVAVVGEQTPLDVDALYMHTLQEAQKDGGVALLRATPSAIENAGAQDD